MYCHWKTLSIECIVHLQVCLYTHYESSVQYVECYVEILYRSVVIGSKMSFVRLFISADLVTPAIVVNMKQFDHGLVHVHVSILIASFGLL